MSRGPGKWQRAIVAILESKKDTADYRHIKFKYPVPKTSLTERRFPELWAAEYGSDLEKYPLVYGWVPVSTLRQECGADSMAAYKALLRSINKLNAVGQIECMTIREKVKGRNDVPIKVARISVDTNEPGDMRSTLTKVQAEGYA